MDYLGIDVALSKPQYLAILSDEDNKSLRVKDVLFHVGGREFSSDNEGIATLAEYITNTYPNSPLSIDAPRAPLAQCNADSTCGRQGEKELNGQGIHLYFTPCSSLFYGVDFSCPYGNYKNHQPNWMEVGFRIYQALHEQQPIEIHPHGTFCRMLWAMNPKYKLWRKTRNSKLDVEQNRAVITAGIEQRKRLLIAYGVDIGKWDRTNNMDEIDAIAAAYTTYLYCRNQTEAVGSSAEGQIILPLISSPPEDYKNPQPIIERNPPQLSSVTTGNLRVRNQDGTEIKRYPTDKEVAAISSCDVLKTPGRADIVYCSDCGHMRIVNPQDFFQVKKCTACKRRRR